MQTYLFINRLSGSYSVKNFHTILEQLIAIGHDPKVFKVCNPVEIASCCAIINEENVPCLLLVAGGDGTVNAVINAIYTDMATIAIIPLGTSNVLAAEIGITSVDDAIKRIACGKTRFLSVGLIEFEERSLRFVLMAGIGLDGAVVRDVVPWVKRSLKQGAYAVSMFKNLIGWNSELFEIMVDEDTIFCHTAIISNASRYGGDFVLSQGVSPFTHGLSAVCITGNSRFSYIKSLYELFRGAIESNTNMLRINATTFKIKGKYPVQIDGDFVGYTPAHISELKDFAKIVV